MQRTMHIRIVDRRFRIFIARGKRCRILSHRAHNRVIAASHRVNLPQSLRHRGNVTLKKSGRGKIFERSMLARIPRIK
ncbi:MAG: hypothetical protein AB7T86_02555 [Xanthobacteraceae bacterium]|uniref:hypothetical protein n=1 Tax=Pseudolabrys sp. TaxID=1960880 RepID=UPI003D0B436D